MRFRDLQIGQKFDWIHDYVAEEATGSYFCYNPGHDCRVSERCKKTSARKWTGLKTGQSEVVGTIDVPVYHAD